MYIYFKSKVKVTRKNGGKIKNKNKNKTKTKTKTKNKKKPKTKTKKTRTSELIPKQKRQNVLTLHSPLCICIKIRFEMVHYSLKKNRKIRVRPFQAGYLHTNHLGLLKGTNVFSSDFSSLPCLLQIYTRLHLSDYREFWNTERLKSFD